MQKMMKDNDKQTKRWLKDFLVSEASGGLIMIFAGLCALILANGETAAWYQAFIHRPITIINVTWPLQHWVNDVLMVLFFFLVGMELKRELLEGFLTDHKQVLLPLAAAIGGMVIPAAIYLFLNRDIPDNFNGWAIASATDIAFALCVLVLVGKRVPPSLKVFLLAIAIFDDLGAILIIAFFYSTLHMGALVGVAAACLLLWALNHFRVPKVAPYILVGIGLWFALHSAGIHTTIGGVLVALAIPMRDHSGRSPINKVMHFLHPWVAFGILPLFAFTSAGISLAAVEFTPLVIGIAAGLFLGKQIGIFGASYALVKAGKARLPDGTTWIHIYGVSLIAGIGFTMSLFIGMLAFPDTALHDQVKLGVLVGSLLSAVLGWAVLRFSKTP